MRLRLRNRGVHVPAPRGAEEVAEGDGVRTTDGGRGPGRGGGFAEEAVVGARQATVQAQFNAPESAAAYVRHHEEEGPSRRFYQGRMKLLGALLAAVPGGFLLDVGCGPGMFLGELDAARPGQFKIAGIDQSPAMIEQARDRLPHVDPANLVVGPAEFLPFAGSTFDAVVATGVLEYCSPSVVLAEIARVLTTDGVVLIGMLNPLAPYRLFEWLFLWPLVRMLGRVEGWLGRPPGRRHARDRTGIRALPPRRLRRELRRAGLRPERQEYFDVTWTVPPVDRFMSTDRSLVPARMSRKLRWLGTGYVVVARKV